MAVLLCLRQRFREGRLFCSYLFLVSFSIFFFFFFFFFGSLEKLCFVITAFLGFSLIVLDCQERYSPLHHLSAAETC